MFSRILLLAYPRCASFISSLLVLFWFSTKLTQLSRWEGHGNLVAKASHHVSFGMEDYSFLIKNNTEPIMLFWHDHFTFDGGVL